MSKMLKLGLMVLGLVMVLGILPASAQKVAVMGAPGEPEWNTEVQNKLIATGFFKAVDVYDLTIVTPTLEQMKGYYAILVYTDDNIVNPTTFGDNLANYVDAGGGVVAAVFATASIPIEGRFNTDNYWAIQWTDQQEDTQETLGTIFVPDHPIFNGVTSFDGGTASYRPSADSLHPDATRIANWTGPGNIPLIATRVINGVRRVDLGFYPPSNDSRDAFCIKTTDGARIMANALLWVAGRDEGTIGTVFTIMDSGFGAKKGKVLIGGAATKVANWTDTAITAVITKAPPPGVYDLVVTLKEPKGAAPIIMPDPFTIMAPDRASVVPDSGVAGTAVTISGNFFSSKKGKVYLGDQSCKVSSWSMDTITFVVPKKLAPGLYDVTVSNKLDSDTLADAFTIIIP